MLGAYVHVPFCSAICHYCNFNRGLYDASVKTRYVGALEAHIRAAGRGEALDSIYFGGGTPSLLEGEEIARVVAACRDTFSVAPDAEITIEANPETVNVSRLAAFREAGVTRVSIGVQSFRDEELRRLGRIHDAGRARASMAAARAAGFDNVSLDLMMWLPGQRVTHWLESVDALIDCAPDHASLYLLELYPNAPLKELMAREQWSQTADDDAAVMYEAAMDRLEAAGLAQYEISNVARPGRQCRHNLKYWRDTGWLAFGCGAHGSLEGQRFRHVAATDEYIARVEAGIDTIAECRPLTSEDQAAEALFMGLRLSEGVSPAAITYRFGIDVVNRYGAALQPFIEDGLLVTTPARWRLTRRGMLLASEIMQVFV